ERDPDGERQALLVWIRGGAGKDVYEEDRLPLTGDLAKLPLTSRFVEGGENNERSAKIKSILDARCARCHSENVGGAGAQYPLDKYEDIEPYTKAEGPTGKSLRKLAL